MARRPSKKPEGEVMFMGLMWLDDDKARPLEEKVRIAVAHYNEKYGSRPELCLVSKLAVAEELVVDDVPVRPAGNVLLHHFWVGREAKS